MKKVILFLITFSSLFIFSCKKDQAIETESVVQSQEIESIQSTKKQDSNNKSNLAPVDMASKVIRQKLDLSNSNTQINGFKTDAHQQFLDDPMEFTGELDDFGITDDYSLLVRGNECKFYLPENFEIVEYYSDNTKWANIKDPKNMDGEIIPLGTIIPELYKDNDYMLRSAGPEWYERECYGLFRFDDCYNYFYKTRWNGQEGYVFGAYVNSDNTLNNEINSMRYKTNNTPDKFYNIEGDSFLPTNIQNQLENEKLAIQRTTPEKRVYVDDMVMLYKTVPTYSSMFVTTDLLSHMQHKFFDNTLQYLEETYFIPRLYTITQKFIAVLSEREDLPDEIKRLAISYFQVPEIILRSAPKKYFDKNKYEEVYEGTDVETFISEYPEDVVADYKQVMAANGSKTNIFETEEDFSQYKPRGHYTRSPALEAYFRAEMWYGRIHFCIAQSNFNPITDKETAKMEPVAMAIVDTVHKNPELYDLWKELFDPITALIGISDDLGFDDVLPLWEEQNITDFAAWAQDSEALADFVTLCHQKLRPPAISGNSSWTGPTDDVFNPPMGWRLFGQRFTYDSDVHQAVSAPRLFSRDFVRGLDIMKAFGSNTAESLLSIEDYTNDKSHYYGGENLREILDEKKEAFDAKNQDFWTQTYYNNVLAQVKTQATFEQGAGFYFTESPMWNIKSMISSHSTWAELRHDTILYVKQVYAERAGGDDLEPTFKYEPIPLPINYIEPNQPFWEYSLLSMQKLTNILIEYDLLDSSIDDDIESFADIMENALEIVKLEAQNKPISEEQNAWIRTIPNKLSYLFVKGSDYSDGEQYKMACIADVFTNVEQGVCLEVGVGTPYKLYVPLNDSQGGKRIAIGYIPSYYEFYHSMNDRMTDEQWKAIVYSPDEHDISEYEPFWINSCILPVQNED